MGKLLADAQEEEALKRNKHELHLSVRLENYPSLKLRFSQQFLIVDYDLNFYSSEDMTGARVIMVKQLIGESKTDISQREFLPINFQSAYDHMAHAKIQNLLDDGCVGVSICHEGITFVR